MCDASLHACSAGACARDDVHAEEVVVGSSVDDRIPALKLSIDPYLGYMFRAYIIFRLERTNVPTAHTDIRYNCSRPPEVTGLL